jgi:phosphatidylinositol 3-kinase
MDNLVIDQISRYQDSNALQSNETCLYIDLPIFDFPVVFNEKEYSYPEKITLRQIHSAVVSVFDAEIFHDNIVESKHRRLARSQRTGTLDRELKPNAKIRDELNV